MQATSFITSSAPTLLRRPGANFSPLPPRGKKPYITAMDASSSSSSSRGSSSNSKKGRDFGGRLVDENMIVLRMRMQENRLMEASDELPPSHWMEWEKKYYVDYLQDVLDAVGILQNHLMHSRPSFTLGIIALVGFAVLVSSGVAFFQAVHMVQVFISRFQNVS